MTTEPRSASGRLLLAFGVASLAAVATGAFVCAHSGVPAGLWARNLAAWGVGGLAALGIALTPRRPWAPAALLAAPVGLGASLISADQGGVHRWVDLGPLHMNVAMVLGPAAVAALGVDAEARPWAWMAAFVALGLLVLQPDASQATALAAALVLIAAGAAWSVAPRAGVMVAAGLLATAAWLRPDPLLPVPEVEQVVGLAAAVSPLAAGLAVVLLAAASLAAAIMTRSAPPGPRRAGRALSLALVAGSVAPWLGAYPVPWVGIGMSPILGAWLGVGLLAARLRSLTTA